MTTNNFLAPDVQLCRRRVLVFFKPDGRDHFCGVVVEVAGRFFTFTAQHALASGTDYCVSCPTLGVEEDFVTIPVSIQPGYGVFGGETRPDAAVAELIPRSQEAVSALALAAIPHAQLLAIRSTNPRLMEARILFTGWSRRDEDGDGVNSPLAFRHLVVETCLAGTHGEPSPPDYYEPSDRIFPLVVCLDRVHRRRRGSQRDFPALNGTSGGAYWLLTDNDGPMLIATHGCATRLQPEIIDGERYLFAFGTSIAAHLTIFRGRFQRPPIVPHDMSDVL